MTDRDQFAAAALTGIVAAGWKNVSDEEAVSWACRLADLMIQKRDAEKMEPPRASSELADRITDYLANGGLFNPEYMEHEKVRRLLMDCRDEIEQSQLTYEEREAVESAATLAGLEASATYNENNEKEKKFWRDCKKHTSRLA